MERSRDARLELALEIAQLGTWVWDLRTGAGELDARGAEIVGLPAGPLEDVGAAQRESIHPDDVASVEAAISAGLATGGVFDLDYRAIVDGAVRHVASRARVLLDEHGQPAQLVGTNRDVTREREAASALRDSELRYRTLFGSIDEGFCIATVILDAEGRPVDYRIDELNPAYERHSGLRDAAGRTAREMVPDIEDVWIETYGRVALTGEPAHLTSHSPALGRWFDVKAFSLGPPGSLRIAILFDDVTDRVRAEQEREASLDRERRARSAAEAFLAVMSHELRTPITSIYGTASLLARPNGRSDVQELASDIVAETERLQRIIDDLLVLSGVERGLLELAPEPLLLHHAIALVAEDVRRRFPGVRLEVDVPILPPVSGDATGVRQVVYNLVSNAAKYAGRSGPIRVQARHLAGSIEISVLDEGPGLGPDPEMLFDLFYRAPHTAAGVAGTGIGLYVVRELLGAMGSSITAENRPSGGAAFTFRLPVVHEMADADLDPASGTLTAPRPA